MRIWRLQQAVAALGLLGLGCSSSTEPPQVPGAIEMIQGDRQVGTLGEALDLPLVVRVTKRRGKGLADAEVLFSIESGDGVFGDSERGPCSPLFPTERVSTTADGYAWVTLVPLSVEPVIVAAQVSGVDEPSLTFTTEVSDPRLSLAIVSGDDQEGVTHEQLGSSFVAQVTDAHGDPLSDVAVVWEVTSGEGRLGAFTCDDLDALPSTLTVRTLADGTTGHDGVLFWPQVYGVSTISASVPGAQGSPLTFTVDVTLQSIWLANPYVGPGFWPDSVTVPVGANVEWWNANPSAHIVSTSEPAGGSPIDSGELDENETFPFVPDAEGTWKYRDEVSGQEGTLTALSK